MLTKIYLNTVPVAFLKWKTMSKMKQSDFSKFMRKTKKLAQILERYLKFKRGQMSRAFEIWKFQYDNDFPFYSEAKNRNELAITRAVLNDNKRKIMDPRPFTDCGKSAVAFDVLIKINDLREICDTKFKKQKRMFFSKLRILYQMEQNLLKDKQPLMLRTLRLNEENLYKNVRFSRKHMANMNPRRFLNMINGKNVHE
jgi:hypothetical protein